MLTQPERLCYTQMPHKAPSESCDQPGPRGRVLFLGTARLDHWPLALFKARCLQIGSLRREHAGDKGVTVFLTDKDDVTLSPSHLRQPAGWHQNLNHCELSITVLINIPLWFCQELKQRCWSHPLCADSSEYEQSLYGPVVVLWVSGIFNILKTFVHQIKVMWRNYKNKWKKIKIK